jgi:hypothetical protein
LPGGYTISTLDMKGETTNIAAPLSGFGLKPLKDMAAAFSLMRDEGDFKRFRRNAPVAGNAIFALDDAGRILEKASSGWQPVSPDIRQASAIAACWHGEDSPLLVAAVGDRVYYRSRDRRGFRWDDAGFPARAVGDVACWSLAPGHTEIFALDAAGGIWRRTAQSGLWRVIAAPGEIRVIAASARHGGDSGDGSPAEGLLVAVAADGTIYAGRESLQTRHQQYGGLNWSPLPRL